MAYPTFTYAISQDSSETTLDDLQIDRASNGTPKGRAFYTVPKMQFELVHQGMSSAEKATLKAFYAANRTTPFDLVWAGDGETYSCLFSAPPRFAVEPGLRWTGTSNLVQV